MNKIISIYPIYCRNCIAAADKRSENACLAARGGKKNKRGSDREEQKTRGATAFFRKCKTPCHFLAFFPLIVYNKYVRK